jgi:hypothetical protein
MADGWAVIECDSLEKVFPDTVPRARDTGIPQAVTLGEIASVQLAFRSPLGGFRDARPLRLTVSGPSAPHVTVSTVELVPCELPAFPDHDAGYLRDTPGLFPDLLKPLEGDRVEPLTGSWRAVWFDLRVDRIEDAGPQRTDIVLADPDGAVLHAFTWEVEVIPVELPATRVVISQWVHADAIADVHDLEVLGEEHWQAIEAYLASAAAMGVTSVLVPVWTPPLDTAVGSYRTSVQLVDIEQTDGGYRFGFDALDRWLDICRRCGITGLEIAHLFTQWGAKCAPAIRVRRGDELIRAFGWDTPARDPAYRDLLEQLLPAMCAHLDAQWERERVVFHISDEPDGREGLAGYLAAKAVVADLLAGWRIVDALSDIEFLREGAVAIPVAATDAVEPFLRERPGELWVYHCVEQNKCVANRFLALPSSRGRVLGTQLFLHGIDGFLHWGFNFYYAWHATRLIDPYRDTTAGGGFLGGDPFIVYPGPDGLPLPSIRYRTFAESINDLRAMEAVARRHGDGVVRALADPDTAVTFSSFSTDPAHYLRVRAALNELLATR